MLTRLLLVGLLLQTSSLYAQEFSVDSNGLSSAEKHLQDFYYSQRRSESSIYSGTMHYGYSSTIEGIPYFQSNDWQNGSLVYENVLYKNVLMRYDEVKGKLIVTENPNGGISISLFSPRVSEFSFAGSRFVYFNKKNEKSSLAEGFYRQIVAGKITAYARTVKEIIEKIEGNTLLRKIEAKTKYYILKNGEYYSVTNKKNLLNILKEHKKEVQQQLSANGFRYRLDPENSIISAVQKYNETED